MAKIDIISGFLGAGKTTLIKKLIAEAFPGDHRDELWMYLLFSGRRLRRRLKGSA